LGREVTEKGIAAARLASDAATADWRARAHAAAAAARDAFFALLTARTAAETRAASLATARRLHEEATARVSAGTLAPVDLLETELGVARRERELLEANKAVQNAEDALRVLLQLPPDARPIPSWPPDPSGPPPPEGEAVAAALAARPELARARTEQAAADLDARVAANARLPSLAFTASAGVSGLAPALEDAASDLAEGRYPFWSAGLALSYPLGNTTAREDLAAARLRALRARAAAASLEASVALEVRRALRDLESKRRQVDVARKALDLAETRLASYLKRAQLGLATTKDTLQAEEDRVAARDALATARADLHGALTRLWTATGEILARHGIELSDAQVRTIHEGARP